MKPAVSQPFFLDGHAGPDGRLRRNFAVHHRPAHGVPLRGHVLCALPFNEEMNRCRSMVTLQALAWAAIGFGTLVLDYHGTGDSDGEHGDARWERWQDDLTRGAAWLDGQPGGCVALWGIRLGAILAAGAHERRGSSRTALLLWQPVIDGKTHLTQFLRVKIAAQMDAAGQSKETTGSMRATLAAGRPVEVAGYELHPELASSIDRARLDQHVVAAGTPLLWLENSVGEAAALSPQSRTLLQHWPGASVEPQVQGFSGPAFWQLHERAVAPDAIARSTAWLQSQEFST